MKLIIYSLILTFLLISAAIAEEAPADIKAVTANGDGVVVHPNGRWEFMVRREAADAQAMVEQFP